MKFINKLANWYFTRRALPYWMVLLIDCLICYLSGLFVFWLYYRGAVTLGNLGILSKTILLYMVFNLIGFRLFRTYSGISGHGAGRVTYHRRGDALCGVRLAVAVRQIGGPADRGDVRGGDDRYDDLPCAGQDGL